MVRTNRRTGVVLFQLGGPDSLDAIEPFLYNLFCDPDIIDFPLARLGRKPLAKLISVARARKVQHHYQVIGGCSPIRRLTERQACALEKRLCAEGLDARCFVAMRYWHPFTEEAVAALDASQCDNIVLLPMYPQYSRTTTGSSLNEWNRKFSAAGRQVSLVNDFYRNSLYLDALVERIEETLARFPDPDDVVLVFSAHSVPVSVIEQGDPYQRQIEETVALVKKRGGWLNCHRLCYQSKVGASKWLQPSLRSTIRELGAAGIKDVCVVPISFVSDHVETLGEINHEARELATAAGITRFKMTEGLNDSPIFIGALAQLVTACVPGMRKEPAFAAPPMRAVAKGY
ncbi:MAG: ferrochelatase [Terriglobales bacterium]